MFTKMAAKLEKIIIIPEHVEVHIENNLVKLKGPKGHTEKKLKHPAIIIKSENNTIHLIADNDSKKEKRVINTFAAHIKNLITGVKEGYQYTLKICSGHFPMTVTVEGKSVIIKNFLGEKRYECKHRKRKRKQTRKHQGLPNNDFDVHKLINKNGIGDYRYENDI